MLELERNLQRYEHVPVLVELHIVGDVRDELTAGELAEGTVVLIDSLLLVLSFSEKSCLIFVYSTALPGGDVRPEPLVNIVCPSFRTVVSPLSVI